MSAKHEKLLLKYIRLWFTTDLQIHFFVISLISYLYIDYFYRVTTGTLNALFSFLIFLPFLALLFFLATIFPLFYTKNKRVMILRMIFLTALSSIILNIKFENIFLLIIQDLFVVPLVFGIGYFVFIFLAAQPDESFPTFKKFIKKFKV